MIHAHNSITEDYLKDYIKLTHEVYPPFLNRLNTVYYKLEERVSNYSEDFNGFYRDVDNPDHGGRYSKIYNLPIYMSTNSNLSDETSEVGLTVDNSTEIKINVDPLVNVAMDIGDILSFQNGLNQYGVYRVINTESSSTLFKPHYRLTIKIVPELTVEKMDKFVIKEKYFLTNYHYVFERGVTLLIISIQKALEQYINYFNEIYNHKLDAHVDNDKCVYLEFDKAFNEMISLYKGHIFTAKIDKSYLCDNLLSYYSDVNPFRVMLGLVKDIDYNTYDYTSHQCTTKNGRLDKARRRMINNRVRIYKLATSTTTGTLHDLTLPVDSILKWDTILNDPDFKNDIKDQLTTFIESSIPDPTDMFGNGVRMSQLFKILDTIIQGNMINKTNTFSTISV